MKNMENYKDDIDAVNYYYIRPRIKGLTKYTDGKERIDKAKVAAYNQARERDMKIELTEQEQSIIANALNHYWNDASWQISENGKRSLTGEKLPLGDIEKQLLEQRMRLVKPLFHKFE